MEFIAKLHAQGSLKISSKQRLILTSSRQPSHEPVAPAGSLYYTELLFISPEPDGSRQTRLPLRQGCSWLEGLSAELCSLQW